MKPHSWLDIFRSKKVLSRSTSTPTMSFPSAPASSPSKNPHKEPSKNKKFSRADNLPGSYKSQYALSGTETSGHDFEIFEDPRCAICDGDLPPTEGRKFCPPISHFFRSIILIPSPPQHNRTSPPNSARPVTCKSRNSKTSARNSCVSSAQNNSPKCTRRSKRFPHRRS